jgi:hypothetical protein
LRPEAALCMPEAIAVQSVLEEVRRARGSSGRDRSRPTKHVRGLHAVREPSAGRPGMEVRESPVSWGGRYVALAELLDAPLAPLDLRLSRTPGPRCDLLTPAP